MIVRKYGRKGTFLILLSVLCLGMAYQAYAEFHTIHPEESILYESWPLWLRLSGWVGTALIMLWGGLSRKHLAIGFIASVIMPI